MRKIICAFAVLLVVTFAAPKTYAQISIGISVHLAPPALPVYSQPPCPVDGYLWTPGYWAYDQDGGYYWVPGVWVAPPRPRLLWTPGYWGYDGDIYVYHEGYWGHHIGFYGGVNYGGGYGGHGYYGGQWSGNTYQYNTAVVNVNNTVVHNTYVNKTVINNVTVNNNTSFNGPGGVTEKPRPEEQAAAKEQHVQPTSDQLSHRQVASKDKSQFAKVNNGKPATAAMNKVGGDKFTPEGHPAHSSKGGDNSASSDNSTANNPDGTPVKKHGHKTNADVTASNGNAPDAIASANGTPAKPHGHKTKANTAGSGDNAPAETNADGTTAPKHHGHNSGNAAGGNGAGKPAKQHSEGAPKAAHQAKPHAEAKPHHEAKPEGHEHHR